MIEITEARRAALEAIVKRGQWPEPQSYPTMFLAEQWEQFKAMAPAERHDSANVWAERARLIDAEMERPTARELQILALRATERQPGEEG